MKIETNEPIEIKITIECNMVLITIDGHDYAVIDNVDTVDDIDTDKVRDWVNETYYTGDSLYEQYMPVRLNIKNFRKG